MSRDSLTSLKLGKYDNSLFLPKDFFVVLFHVCLPASFLVFFLSHILSYWAFILDFPQVLEEVSCTTLLFLKY